MGGSTAYPANSGLYGLSVRSSHCPWPQDEYFVQIFVQIVYFKAQSTLGVSTFVNVRHLEGRTSLDEFICVQSRHFSDRTSPPTHESSQGFIYYLNIFSIRIHLLFLYSTPQGKQKCKYCKVTWSCALALQYFQMDNQMLSPQPPRAQSYHTCNLAVTHLCPCSLIKRCAFPLVPLQQLVWCTRRYEIQQVIHF